MPSWILQSCSKLPFRSDARCSFSSFHKSPTKTKPQRMVSRHTSRKEWNRQFLKDAFAAAKLDDTNKKKVSDHSVRRTSVGWLLEADVQPNFVAQLSGHKNLKSLDSFHSASLKRQRNMSAILNRESGTSAQSEKTKSVPPLHYNTAKCFPSPTNPASSNFCRSAYWQVRRLHIQLQRFLCSRKSQGWIRSDQTGFIKGRYIGQSIRLLNDLINFTDANKIPGIFLFIDFEKAFDTLEWKKP